jgi:hypothetical protein
VKVRALCTALGKEREATELAATRRSTRVKDMAMRRVGWTAEEERRKE